MLLALAGVSSVAMAQQKTEVVEEFGVIQVQDKYQVITNPFWSNWFFSIGGGAEATFGDNDKAGSFGKRISPTLNFAKMCIRDRDKWIREKQKHTYVRIKDNWKNNCTFKYPGWIKE